MTATGSEAAGTNWAGSYAYRARELVRPTTLEELATCMGQADSVRVLASRHTFNDMADADLLLSLDHLPEAREVTVDPATMTVRVGAAVTYAALAQVLNAEGLALENLASLPHISVAGAIGTATHGSGDRLGNLATAVRGVELMTASGDRLVVGAHDPRLAGVAVHLGALGVVLAVTLAVVPFYEVSQHVYDEMEWEALYENLDAVYAMGHSVSVFHRFGARTQAVWVKARAGARLPRELFGAQAADGPRHPIAGVDPINCTPQLGETGPWSERLPHFRSGFMPSAGEEIQSEVFVPRVHAVNALRALREVGEQVAPQLLTGELRTVAADGLWMSPQYGCDTLGMHFTWRRSPAEVAQNVVLIESALAPFSARSHWGKVTSFGADRIAAGLERGRDFAALRADLDPDGRFVNEWMRRTLPGLLDP